MFGLVDGQGVSFDEYRDHLPKSSHDFPRAGIVRDKRLFAPMSAWYHETFPFCFLCGRPHGYGTNLQCHHLIGGPARSHEKCNLVILDRRCHEESHGGGLARILWWKWKIDRENTDWGRLAVIRGRFLPDMIAPNSEETLHWVTRSGRPLDIA